jgi:glycerate kinase
VRIVAAPDKFRGTATAPEVAAAVAVGAAGQGIDSAALPMSDGGEGFLEAFGGPNRTTEVTGPLGEPVAAAWRLDGRTAVIEMARASGLSLVGGAEANDPLAASTIGTGQLIGEAIDRGARRVLVGHGGSATTDGGLPALRNLGPLARLKGVELVAAVDVRCRFVDAAERFAPQKGASPSQVRLLHRRLERLAQVYLEEHGVDVTALEGAGAAGGLAGGLAAAGAEIVSGFEVVADEVDLVGALEGASLVVTGEGHLDEGSFDGKVVGGVLELAAQLSVPTLVVAGAVDPGAAERAASLGAEVAVVDLARRFGAERAWADVAGCIAEVVSHHLDSA